MDTFGKMSSLPSPAALELFDLGAQCLMAGDQRGHLPLQLNAKVSSGS
jgi:hypothetical protein